MFKCLRKWFRTNDSGSASVEFVVLFPFFMATVFAGIEGGWMMTRFMMVERGVDVAMREVRLGVLKNPSYETLRDRICDVVTVVDNCNQNLVLTTEIVRADETVSTEPAPCFDRTASQDELDDFNPADGHNTGSSSQIVVIKICAIVDPLLRNYGLSNLLTLDDSGGFPIRTKTAFLNEPF